MPIIPKPKKKPWQQERVVQGRRLHDNSKFYNSRAWRKVSKAYKLAHPVCECKECKEKELLKPSNVTDHIKGLQFLLDNKLDPYDWKELQAMSSSCHNKKSGRDAHKNKIK
ncbi:HNH endonuclease [Polaribacter haliotis]|uniref:HNH endonuclease n=1 Tax=Polaribacter haliotis TaxID=1888915 RepID=A0A7L8AF50_9FLAO|nr:HNH endonuclease [Polaribacter haliotis]QOD60631.1 HNH endonuclease [Polaribacter haliotis]